MCSWRNIRSQAAGLAVGLTACVGTPPPVAEPPILNPDLVQRGAFLFIDPRVSGDGQRACATCHPGGGSDGKTYVRGLEVEPGTPGARRTRTLRGAWQRAPYFWDGSAASIREAIEQKLATVMAGARLPDHDLAALEAYVLSLSPFDRGRVLDDGTPREPVSYSARRGFGVFTRARCGDCHPAPVYAVARSADVGTGGSFDVPTLRGVGELPALGHDGRWGSLEDAVKAMLSSQALELSFDERLQLMDYLKLL